MPNNITPATVPGDDPRATARTVDHLLILARVDQAIQANPAGAARLWADIAARGADADVDAAVAAHSAIEVPVTVKDVTVVHRGLIPRQRSRYLAAVLGMVAAAALVLGAGATAPAAEAATYQAVASAKGAGLSLRPAPAHKGALWAGQYIDSAGNRGWCVDYLLGLSDGTVSPGPVTGRFPSAEAGARAIKLAEKYKTTRDNRTSAYVWLALASLIAEHPRGMATADQRSRAVKLAADLPRYLAQVGAAGQNAVAAMLEESKSHSPYRAIVTTPKAAAGRTAAATVKVLDSRGQGAAGMPLTVTVLGGTGPARVTTGRDGTAQVPVQVSALSYTVTATGAAVSGTRALLAIPSSPRLQVLIGGGATDTYRALGCATICPVSARISIDAGCDDAGRHTVTADYRAEAIPGSYRGWITVGGTRTEFLIAAGETRSVSAQLADGQPLAAGFDILSSTGAVLVSRTLYASAGVA